MELKVDNFTIQLHRAEETSHEEEVKSLATYVSTIGELGLGTYRKGYIDKTTDYKLNYMTKIEVKSLERELKAGEITSDTEPSFEELWKAQKNVQTIISSRVVRATQP